MSETKSPLHLPPARRWLGGLVGLVVVAAALGVATVSVRQFMRRGENPSPPPVNVDYSPALAPAGPPGLAVGETAPDFSLPSVQAGPAITRSEFQQGRPMVLILGSFSCDLFCKRIPELRRLYDENHHRAAFLFVNVTEAGHQVPGLEFLAEGGFANDRTPLDERRAKVQRAINHLKWPIPTVIDAPTVKAENLYQAFPLRLVAIDAEGRIAMDLGRVVLSRPWDLEALEDWLDRPNT